MSNRLSMESSPYLRQHQHSLGSRPVRVPSEPRATLTAVDGKRRSSVDPLSLFVEIG